MKKTRKPHVQKGKPPVCKTHRFALLGLVMFAAIAVGLVAASSFRSAGPASPPAGVAPAGMKWITGAEFTMGTDDANSMPNERPARRVTLKSFFIDTHDVTNAQFRAFVEATGYVMTAEKAVD
jgi:formylglycine-generating enzyme required for sulfatase activity